MAGWDGAGNFNLQYNWVTDAANALPISSSRMQTQDQLIATGLQNCWTLDGQNSLTANANAGGFRITNMGAPSSGTDAATKAYVDGLAGQQWVNPGTFGYTWISTVSFKVNSSDFTSIIKVGMRLKISHNGGGSTSYMTVTYVNYGAPDTTIAGYVDSNLVAPVVQVWYSLLTQANDALPRYTRIGYKTSAVGTQIMVSGVACILGKAGSAYEGTQTIDTLGEMGTSVFGQMLLKQAGTYRMLCRAAVNNAGVTWTLAPQITFRKNGAVTSPSNGSHLGTTNLTGVTAGIPGFDMKVLTCVANDYLEVAVTGGFSAGSPTLDWDFMVERIA